MPKPSAASNKPGAGPVANDGAPPAGGAPDMPGGSMGAGMEIGLMLVVAVMGLGALGLLIDQITGWGPWMMLLGGFAGFGGWLVSVARRKRS